MSEISTSRYFGGRSVPLVRWSLAPCLLLLVFAGCKGGGKEDPILRLSAQESFAQGQDLMAQEKYAQARQYLTHAFEVEPNSAEGRQALLMVADSHFLDGGYDNFIKAEAKYRDFQNRFPTSDRSDYIQYQVARSLSERMERPDRDQEVTRKALEAFRDLVTLYPTSEYVAEAREQIVRVRSRLAEHEYVVGYFYYRFNLPTASVSRFEYLIENFPDYPEMDKVYFQLAKAYHAVRKAEDAQKTFAELKAEYPDSEYTRLIEKEAARMEKQDAKREAKAAKKRGET